MQIKVQLSSAGNAQNKSKSHSRTRRRQMCAEGIKTLCFDKARRRLCFNMGVQCCVIDGLLMFSKEAAAQERAKAQDKAKQGKARQGGKAKQGR